MRSVLLAASVAASLALLTSGAHADTTPASGAVVGGGTVSDMVRSGSTVFVSGNFNYVGPRTGPATVISTSTARPDGTMPEVSGGDVEVAISDGAGGWYLGGSFRRVGGVGRDRIAHVLANGTVDPAFDPAANRPVRSLLLAGSVLYAGGDFTEIGGRVRRRIAALNATTGAASAWNPSITGANLVDAGTVSAMALSGTTLVVGGVFGNVGTNGISHIAALDTTNDANPFIPWPDGGFGNFGANNDVRALALSASGTTVYVGGSFTTIGGQSRNRLAEVSVATGAATAFNPNVATGGTAVNDLVREGTTLYAAGSFSLIAGQQRFGLAALDTTLNTNNATTWDPDSRFDISTIALSGSSVFAGGSFGDLASDAPRQRLAAFDKTTGAKTSFDASANGTVNTLALAGTRLFTGGSFTSAGGRARLRVAAFDAVTGIPTALDIDTDGAPSSIAVAGGALYLGGFFTQVNGDARSQLAAVDATTGATLPWNPNGNSGFITELAASGSTVYVAGDFTQIGGASRSGLAALDGTTAAATAWNPGDVGGGAVEAIVPSGGLVYVGGAFTSIGDFGRQRAAALDATIGQPTAWNPAPNGTVQTLAVSGSAVYAGGFFSEIGGAARNRIAALDASPAKGLAQAWNPGANGAVNTLAIGDGTVYAGGEFTQIGGASRTRLAALDAATGAPTPWDPPADQAVNRIVVVGASVVAAGNFTTVGGFGSGVLGLAQLPPSPPQSQAAPVVTGSGQVGQALTCSTGTWSESPTGFARQWLRNGTPIGGETGASYTVAAGDDGQPIGCRVTATNAGGSTAATSAAVTGFTPGSQGNPGPQGNSGAQGPAGQNGTNGTNGAQGPAGSAGQTGPPGVQGPAGPQGPRGATGRAGRDARVTCTAPKPKKGQVKVTCKVTLTASKSSSVRARLERGGRTYASGVPVRRDGRLSLRFSSSRKLKPGRYTLVVNERTRAGRTVTRIGVTL